MNLRTTYLCKPHTPPPQSQNHTDLHTHLHTHTGTEHREARRSDHTQTTLSPQSRNQPTTHRGPTHQPAAPRAPSLRTTGPHDTHTHTHTHTRPARASGEVNAMYSAHSTFSASRLGHSGPASRGSGVNLRTTGPHDTHHTHTSHSDTQPAGSSLGE